VAAPGTEIALLEPGSRTSYPAARNRNRGSRVMLLRKGCLVLSMEQDRGPGVCDRPARNSGRSPTLRGRGVFVVGNGDESGEDGSR
jgi:hypothetical protein